VEARYLFGVDDYDPLTKSRPEKAHFDISDRSATFRP
jgi:hypothetical protein